jgi:integrase
MRLGDCCRLTWSSVDLDENFITATTHKTGKSVEIPILPELRAELLQHVDNGSQYCFPGPADMYESNPDGIQRRIGLVLKDAGFSREDCTQERRGLKRANVLGFHALRTTGATRLLAAGVPPETVIKITGHTSVKTLMDHYDQRSMRQRRAVIREAMEKAAGQQNKRESKEKRLREILADMKPKRLRDEALKILDGDF